MSYTKPKYSRTSVDRAGRILATDFGVTEGNDDAWEVLGNWRASHAFPLNTITVGLKNKVTRLGINAIVVQRLKRSRSILGKLSRDSMRLSQMQDIGGCRAVVSKISDVYALRDNFKRSRSKHELISIDDYITNPKASGYRGIHLVYKFQSQAKPEFNKLLLEVQLRTEAQHAWATAVETVGAVLGQALKASQGEAMWLAYFQVASLALEYSEEVNASRSLPLSREEVAKRLVEYDRRLEVRKRLAAYSIALRATDKPQTKNAAYFILLLLPDEPGLQIFAFTKDEAELAQLEYQRFERQLPLRSRQLALFPELADYTGAQVVLVGAESLKSIRDAYPNYYLDTGSFIEKIDSFKRLHRRSIF